MGLGLGYRDMIEKLAEWGYDVGQRVCMNWLGTYRFGNTSFKDGCASLYALSLRDLQRWFHVDGLRGSALVDKYRLQTGVFAHASHLKTWLEAPEQQLPVFDNNEDIHSHECGDFALKLLQEGQKPAAVIEQLLDKYLVRCTSEQRLVAYRTYREQRGKYWTAEHLARVHWEYLYSLVSLDKTLGLTKNRHLVPNRRDQAFETLQSVRVTMCDHLKLAEELVPLDNLLDFFLNTNRLPSCGWRTQMHRFFKMRCLMLL